MNTRYNSRKFIIAAMAIVSVSTLVYLKLIDGGVYATVMVATIGAYLTANVVQKQVESLKTG